jgi:hypothetical protein
MNQVVGELERLERQLSPFGSGPQDAAGWLAARELIDRIPTLRRANLWQPWLLLLTFVLGLFTTGAGAWVWVSVSRAREARTREVPAPRPVPAPDPPAEAAPRPPARPPEMPAAPVAREAPAPAAKIVPRRPPKRRPSSSRVVASDDDIEIFR